jgi:hypothetical protein
MVVLVNMFRLAASNVMHGSSFRQLSLTRYARLMLAADLAVPCREGKVKLLAVTCLTPTCISKYGQLRSQSKWTICHEN